MYQLSNYQWKKNCHGKGTVWRESIAVSLILNIPDYVIILPGGICMFLDTSMYLCCQIYLYEFRYNHSTFVDLLDCCRDKEKGLVT